MMDDYGTQIDRRTASSKFSIDNKISINTIIACITLASVCLAVMDRFSANAATTAVIQNKQISTDQRIDALTQQRLLDRQELLIELREIKQELREKNMLQNRK